MGKISIVTGANSGIGKEAARQLMQKKHHVILACRNRERGEKALNELLSSGKNLSAELMIVDMGLMESVRSFAREFQSRYSKLDVLIHNAAIFNVTQKDQIKTSEGIENVWAANHLGPVLLTTLLDKELRASEQARILTVSSQGLAAKPLLKVNFDDPEYNRRKFNIVNAYYQSKRAQVMYTYWLAEQYKETAITVNSIRVTAVKIDISRHPELSPFMKWVYTKKSKMSLTPAQMAETYTYLAESDDVKTLSGYYFNEKNKQVKSAPWTYSPENQKKVMELTAQYIPELKL